MIDFYSEWRRGHDTEACVIEWLRQAGFVVTTSSEYENIELDIDCYIKDRDGINQPISIKDETSGLAYNDVYFELRNLWRKDNKWRPSWYYTGKAEYYIIVQGGLIRVIRKNLIVDHIHRLGWHHVSGLSHARRRSQEMSHHQHVNTVCGYLKVDSFAHRVYTWESQNKNDYTEVRPNA